MKNILGFAASLALLAGTVTAASAAAVSVSFGSLGQRAGDSSTFGISVCNNGSSAITSPVPMTVTANDISVSGSSAAPIPSGSCAYTYFPYSSFNMVGGTQYAAVASSPDIASAPYSVQMPGLVLGASIAVPQGPVSQGTIDLMANEVVLMKQLIALIQGALGR